MRRRGFTLIELLLAMAMASLFMAALTGVIGMIARDRARLAMSGRAADSASARIIDLVRRDLTNGRRVWVDPDGRGFTITGYGGLTRQTHEPDGRLARVSYAIEGGALYRRQAYMDDPLRPDAWAEMVAAGVDGVSLALEASSVAEELGPDESSGEMDRGMPISSAASLEVQFAQVDRPGISRRLIVR
jgi:prepilin-type N-terminal cleavage/methylation domain-containing protein